MNKGKVRIYEISRELSLDNKEVLGICQQLNIPVKSHSSTITESQAERIRAAAERFVASNASAKGSRNTTSEKETSSPSVKPNGQPHKERQQHILAVRKHKRSDPEPSSPPSEKSEQSQTPELATPPKHPTKPQPPSKPNQPEPPTQSSEEAENPTADNESEQPTHAAAESDPPQLMEPPSIPKQKGSRETQPERPTLKRPKKTEPSTSRSEPTPAPNRGAKNQSKPSVAESSSGSEATPVGDAPGSKESRQPAKAPPKLKQPPKPKSSQVSKQEEITTSTEPETETVEEDTQAQTLSEPPERQPQLKRPIPRPAKRKARDSEEESTQETEEKASTKSKKRRPKPVIEDDEEELESSEQEISAPSPASMLSLERPAKPESRSGSSAPKATPTSTSKPKKQAPKTGGVPSKQETREKRREKVKTPKLPEKVVLSGEVTVRDLAERLNVSETEIIKKLFFKGVPVNVTQTLDVPTARMVAEEIGVSVETPEEKSSAEKVTEMLDTEDLENLQPRPPVVTIMGHVDHGKTSLLDSIRKTKVAQGEAGGITQHIGAYHVDVELHGQQKQVVFLDTPGHEAFTAMRARGARVTDVGILVIAADDGVQPQTKEAVSHAKAAGISIVVAINKVDKPGADPERVKQELTQQDLVPEEWGGDTIMVPVSATQGENLDTLLEMILLVTEIEELSANPNRLAKGTVVEANLDRARGPVATLLVQNGTLRVGDTIVAGSVFGRIRAMIDDRGERVEAASPSFAVEVLGLGNVPSAGDEFDVFEQEKEARAVAAQRSEQQRQSRLQQAMASRRVSLSGLSAQAQEGELKELNLIVKADVQGSVEAILGALEQLPQNEVQVRVLLAAPGEITETDVDLAAASGAVIVGFNTTLASGATTAADQEGIDVREYNVIYRVLDDIRAAMEGMLEPEEVEESLGKAEVRAVFPVGRGAVAGCYILSGKVVRNRRVRVRRGDEVVYEGALDSLKRVKDDVREVNAGFECGIGAPKFSDWKEGDIIEAYQMVTKRRSLSPS
ncbi:MAG: translation initiation factor IF-2 [Cyanobacteria bacterium SW_8_48_13]|nr:MAG: translation initiation factor IF-2 [Cyanobacteria bacterium SW_8_48_13]